MKRLVLILAVSGLLLGKRGQATADEIDFDAQGLIGPSGDFPQLPRRDINVTLSDGRRKRDRHRIQSICVVQKSKRLQEIRAFFTRLSETSCCWPMFQLSRR